MENFLYSQSVFAIEMDDQNYDCFHTSLDPDELLQKAQGYFNEIRALTMSTSRYQIVSYLEHVLYASAEFIFGSNFIENAGLDQEVTQRLCRDIFLGNPIPSDAELLKFSNRPKNFERSLKEIVQYALAWQYLSKEFVASNAPLSEDIILQTHNYLTDGIDASDGDKSSSYSGVYRTESVGSKLATFTPPNQVPSAMKCFVKEFNDDIVRAEKKGSLDPYMLAAKYCHKFVNIYPFLDGNRRACRLILNGILLKYTGIVAPFGGNEREKEEYLEIAVRASMDEQVAEDERSRVPWGELASYMLGKGVSKMEGLRKELQEPKV
ncbi:hypothetical protein G7Y89_g9287 [Cudoniella acicularis]|uniref:Fido domain-containing protein n=1 Tax=Cudoniella acicularis TaxID=354080 RepID=A0A8H4RH62_9HELO|nr:hypothetical protein G7Y89_g9287 [Cudoniella acicularis]